MKRFAMIGALLHITLTAAAAQDNTKDNGYVKRHVERVMGDKDLITFVRKDAQGKPALGAIHIHSHDVCKLKPISHRAIAWAWLTQWPRAILRYLHGDTREDWRDDQLRHDTWYSEAFPGTHRTMGWDTFAKKNPELAQAIIENHAPGDPKKGCGRLAKAIERVPDAHISVWWGSAKLWDNLLKKGYEDAAFLDKHDALVAYCRNNLPRLTDQALSSGVRELFVHKSVLKIVEEQLARPKATDKPNDKPKIDPIIVKV